MKQGVGIVGAGWIAEKVHLPFILANPNVNYVGVYDVDNIRLQSIVNENSNIRSYNSYDDVLRDENIDIVIILTPNFLHFKQIKQAIYYGKKVFCEKPICINNEIDDLKKLMMEKKDYYIYPLLPNRYKAEINELRSAIKEIGEVYKVYAGWTRGKGIPTSGWFLDKNKSGGGVLVDLGSHLVDVLLYILEFPKIELCEGNLVSHFTTGENNRATWREKKVIKKYEEFQDTVEDSAQVFLKNKKTSMVIDLCWDSYLNEDKTYFEIHGTQGFVRLETLFGFSNRIKENKAKLILTSENKSYSKTFDIFNRHEPYHLMLEDYFEMAANNQQLNIEDIMKSIELLSEIYRRSEL
ncbi:Gfo/Idh/MocA family oxidoreductase [Bacillus cereus]|nr:Gfo/Idh/MocA family oxidoreductase [Bacillus cereus]